MKIIEKIMGMFGFLNKNRKPNTNTITFIFPPYNELMAGFNEANKSGLKRLEYCETLEKAIDEENIEKLRNTVNKEYSERNDYYLYVASMLGNANVVKILLENGADVNHKNGVCLRAAISRDFVETVKVLLEHGADIHAIGENSFFKMAVMNKKMNTLKFLLIDYNITISNELQKWMEENNHQEALEIYKKRELNKKLSQTFEYKQEKRMVVKI